MAENKKTALKVVPPDKKKCIWMEAGVVSYKLCDNNFDCQTCTYDQGMQLKVARERADLFTPAPVAEPLPQEFTPTWVEQMMRLPAHRRKCRSCSQERWDGRSAPTHMSAATAPSIR
jgi:hypothetical protein